MGSQTPTPNVTVTAGQATSTITALTGNLIAFLLPFGSRWTGPTTSQGNLALLPPAGYADTTAHACVWRFVAQRTGVTQLAFTGGPLCSPGQLCPFFVMLLSFTVVVK